MTDSCCCGSVKLIYSCSGAANTGQLSDSVTRKLGENDIGNMTCLSAIGAGLSGFIESAKCAKTNIVIDGCHVSCGKKIFDNHNLSYEHYVITDFDVEKGKTEITTELINIVTNKFLKKIG